MEAASRALFAMMPGSAPSDGRGSPVQGSVVDARTHWPIGGAQILVGAERTTTDANGHFTLHHVPATYDITIADSNAASVSVYRGLHRRNPLLSREPSRTKSALTIARTRFPGVVNRT